MDGSFQLMLLIAYDFNYFFENKYLEIFNLHSASECWYTDNGLQCPEPSKCYYWRMQFNLVSELQSDQFSPDALVFKAEIYDKHILMRNYQTKGKFLPNYSSSNVLHQVAINTAKFGLTKFFHQQNGDFVVISFGRFTQPIGYFWGYHDGQLYKFKVFQAKFSFKLAFDRNSLSYLELFNAYPFGAGKIQTDTGIIITVQPTTISTSQLCTFRCSNSLNIPKHIFPTMYHLPTKWTRQYRHKISTGCWSPSPRRH